MTKRPNWLDFTAEEIETLIERIEQQSLEANDFPLLADLVRAMVWMEGSLREKSLSIARLKAIFGIKAESAKRLKGLLQPKNKGGNRNNENKEASRDIDNDASNENPPNEDSTKGHGHRPASDYEEAQLIKVAHEALGPEGFYLSGMW